MYTWQGVGTLVGEDFLEKPISDHKSRVTQEKSIPGRGIGCTVSKARESTAHGGAPEGWHG